MIMLCLLKLISYKTPYIQTEITVDPKAIQACMKRSPFLHSNIYDQWWAKTRCANDN